MPGWLMLLALLLTALMFTPSILEVAHEQDALILLLVFGTLGLILGIIDRQLSFILKKRSRMQKQQLVEAFSELARHTGLIFDPGGTTLPRYGISDKSAMSGKFRGRHLSLTLSVTWSDSDLGIPPYVYVIISLPIRNSALFSLAILEKRFSTKAFTRSGNEVFDRWFRVKGDPKEFVNRAIRLLVQHPTIMVTDPQRLIMKTNPDRTAWAEWATAWKRPSIMLEESDLLCYQNGIFADVHDQIALLNLLCDLAELAEEMGKGDVKYRK